MAFSTLIREAALLERNRWLSIPPWAGRVRALPAVRDLIGTIARARKQKPPEPSTGRLTAGQTDGSDYVYVAGDTHLFRYRYADGQLSLDSAWGPVTYRTGTQMPGTGSGEGPVAAFARFRASRVAREDPVPHLKGKRQTPVRPAVTRRCPVASVGRRTAGPRS